jgi:hypothetical protein
MNSHGIPGNDSEADALRAYVPLETLKSLHAVCAEEIVEHEKRRKKQDEVYAEIAAIKERMKRDRLALKKLEAQQREYFSRPIFPRTDAARDAAWTAAGKARAEALARGESPRFETAKECGARQKVGAVYTP